MTKSQSSLLAAFLLAISFPIHAENDPALTEIKSSVLEKSSHTFAPFTGCVTGSKVRMRVQPSLEGHVVRETANGDMFIVVSEAGDYYGIVPPKETKGYVFRTFVLDGTVEGERVNVRLYPDIDAPVVGQLNTGDKVQAVVSDVNNKWLEIALPENSRFYLAKEYIENKGPPELLISLEKRQSEAAHLFSAATLFAQAEIQKPFEQIDLDRIIEKFATLSRDFPEYPNIVDQVGDITSVMQEIYMQKKIAFLESKANNLPLVTEIGAENLTKLAKLGIEIKPSQENTQDVAEIAEAASNTMGLASTLKETIGTDKMNAWLPLEKSVYHLWAATNGEKSMQEFYDEEQKEALLLTGFVEPYTRPVKNRPGDFLLRSEGLPVAFLYSTQINLEKLVGQKVTLLAAPRPNHNFAFPAYFVISVE